MATRSRQNFLYGTLSGFTAGATTLTGTGFPGGITVGTYLPIIINPGYAGVTASGEIAYITAVAGNTATVTRAQEGTVAISGTQNTPWVAGPIASDFDVSNLTSTGTLTLANALVVSGIAAFVGSNTFASNATFSGAITASGITVNNNAVISGNLSVSGSIAVPSGSITYSGIKSYGPWYAPGSNGTFFSISQNAAIASTPSQTITVSGYNNYYITAQFVVSPGTVSNGVFWGIATPSGLYNYPTFVSQIIGITVVANSPNQVLPYSCVYSPGSTAPKTLELATYTNNSSGGVSYAYGTITAVGIN